MALEGLQVEIPTGGGDEGRYRAVEIVFERCLGRPVAWRAVIEIPSGDHRLPYLAALLEVGALKAKAFLGTADLGLEGIVVGAEWCVERSGCLILEFHSTMLAAAPSPAPDPDPFTPRWRVHDKVQNLLKLAQRFSHVATLPNWVKTPMEKVKFTPDDYTSVLQDGLSDWTFLSHLLDQYGALGAEAALKPLILTGSVEAAPGKWIVTFGSKAAYEKMNDVSNRKVEPETDVIQSFAFGGGSLHPPSERPSSLVPTASRLWKHRPFTAAAWKAWIGKDLPLFTKEEERFIYRITDRLTHADAKGEKVEWITQLDPALEGAVVAGPEPPSRMNPWLRIGEVSETKPVGPWIKVKLEGFESGSETVQARLQSPYSGKNGKRGLHLVPENTTKVMLAWSGRFHEPLLVIGNIRDQEAEFQAPSVWLEDLVTEQYVDVLVKEIGRTTVESAYDLTVKKAVKLTAEDTTDLLSTKALTFKSDDTADLSSAKAMTLKSQDAASFESSQAMTLKSQADIKAEGMNVGVKGQTGLKLEGAQVEMAGQGTIKVSSSGILEIQGSLVKIN